MDTVCVRGGVTWEACGHPIHSNTCCSRANSCGRSLDTSVEWWRPSTSPTSNDEQGASFFWYSVGLISEQKLRGARASGRSNGDEQCTHQHLGSWSEWVEAVRYGGDGSKSVFRRRPCFNSRHQPRGQPGEARANKRPGHLRPSVQGRRRGKRSNRNGNIGRASRAAAGRCQGQESRRQSEACRADCTRSHA